MFGLQLASKPDLTKLQTSLFGGITFEPVTGVALSGGVIFQEGATPRAYFGVTFGFELFNTTARRLQAKAAE